METLKLLVKTSFFNIINDFMCNKVFISYIVKINTFNHAECASLLVGTDKYHIQVSHHHLIVGKSALNEYDQYAAYLAILNHGEIDIIFSVCSHLHTHNFIHQSMADTKYRYKC